VVLQWILALTDNWKVTLTSVENPNLKGILWMPFFIFRPLDSADKVFRNMVGILLASGQRPSK
jgi:hypothetical protein